MIGYHFTSNTLRDGRPIPSIGEWLIHEGPVIPCVQGLYMSEHPFDALTYAQGNILHRVELIGNLRSHGNPIDKWDGLWRRILASIDAESLLREFARWCALQVIDLWDAPDVVREYLETGDESKRDAACASACAAAWAAARDAARCAVRAAARDAAWDAAWAAACAAACAAAWDAAWAAAWAAARTAPRDAARTQLQAMVDAAFKQVEEE